jgi:hypothetical protein
VQYTWLTHNGSHIELLEGQSSGICTVLLYAATLHRKRKLTFIDLNLTVNVQCHLEVLERVKDGIGYIKLLSAERRM